MEIWRIGEKNYEEVEWTGMSNHLIMGFWKRLTMICKCLAWATRTIVAKGSGTETDVINITRFGIYSGKEEGSTAPERGGMEAKFTEEKKQ